MKPLKFISIILTFCILSSFTAFCITGRMLKSKPVNKKEKAEDLFTSSLTFSQSYKKCGHTTTIPTGTITYSSAEELQKRFPGYEITSGENENLVLSTEIDNFCTHHYKAILSGNKIIVTRLSDKEEITTFAIIPSSLSEEEKDLLEQGVTIGSQKALSSFVEDFTS